jgi:hypothetical protein
LIFSLSTELIRHTYFDAVSNRRLETQSKSISLSTGLVI